MCCDHSDTGGGAENRTGDPGDGGWITPICQLNDTQGAAVRGEGSSLTAALVRPVVAARAAVVLCPPGTEGVYSLLMLEGKEGIPVWN